jgi:hypothetical protein
MPYEELKVNAKDSAIAEFTMAITKARYDANEVNPNRRMQWRSVNSDVDADLYEESMSTELFYDFVHRIRDNVPIPEEFEEVICEGDWCGGMPYLSVAHYKAGTGAINVPGLVDSVYVEGDKLKSRGFCNDSPLGQAVYESLKNDIVQKRSGNQEHKPVRISIGFLDLQHKHVAREGGQEFVFTRSHVGEICPLCSQDVGGKIYVKGQLIHLALTRVPVNPRTEMVAEGMEEKSMNEITTKKQDAESIVGDLANELEEKSFASDVLVVRADNIPETRDDLKAGSSPKPDPSELTPCYDENTGGWNPTCIESVMSKYMPAIRDSVGVPIKSEAMPKDLVDAVVSYLYKSNGIETPVVEDAMEAKEVTPAVPVTPAVEVKAETKEVEKEEKEVKEETKEMSAVEKSFVSLQEAIKSGDVDAVNKAFGSLGTSVEGEFKPVEKPVDANDIAAIVKSAVAEALAPVIIDIATLKAGAGRDTVSNSGIVKSKALSLNPTGQKPEDIVRRSGQQVANQPMKQLSQIEKLARRSTGLPTE